LDGVMRAENGVERPAAHPPERTPILSQTER
jgi:hypothetical protein